MTKNIFEELPARKHSPAAATPAAKKGTGDGQFDAFINAIRKIYSENDLKLPKLIDYSVTIPPGSNSDALCETFITWKTEEKEFITRGLDSDQTVSAIKSTEKMLNIICN